MRHILFALIACILLTGCHSNSGNTPPEPPPIPVIAARPTVKDVTFYLDSIGTLSPAASVDIRPQVDGTIEEVFVKEGDFVDARTPLFSIDAASYVIKVDEAQAQLAMAEADHEVFTKKLERFKHLAQKDLISQNEWDELETQVAKSKYSVQLDTAYLTAAELALDHCILRSPIAGRLGKLDVQPGLLVTSGQPTPLVTVVQFDPLTVEFSITEKEYAKVHGLDVPIDVEPLACTGTCRKGVMTFLDNHFDPKTGLLLIRGRVDNPEHLLRPGQSVRIRIPLSVAPQVLMIPQRAIKYNQHGPYVYVVQPDHSVVLRQLILGEEQGENQIVIQGLDPEEQVILDGHLRLSPGAKVVLLTDSARVSAEREVPDAETFDEFIAEGAMNEEKGSTDGSLAAGRKPAQSVSKATKVELK